MDGRFGATIQQLAKTDGVLPAPGAGGALARTQAWLDGIGVPVAAIRNAPEGTYSAGVIGFAGRCERAAIQVRT